ncbi:NAD(P)H-binding protein [Saccharibacillus sp. CPCC 101409]|uniref:NAD(P)-dependent oxidoreductase n=1 Tax=Saccharibacillus sp. CPCC 101409 TaxID=3058041 RepID=UPI002673BD42|nr:NAD(P)H-binding protein [Saccharibacillus sp. CPCC 101409]MDO3411401.1 NAD(P)H-binding protein [Saccharibacillus sp. CPCC 101409]
MKILVLGAGGTIGRRIVEEALNRKCEVKALLRDPSLIGAQHDELTALKGDLLEPGEVARAAAGCDAVVSAFGLEAGEGRMLAEAARMIVEGTRAAGVERLIVAGGAGTLFASPGVRLMDTPDYPEELRPLALAHAEAYEIYARSDLDWTYASPAAWIEPGRRTGNFRIGTMLLVTDDEGHSRISAEDFAAALIDELDDPNFIRSRFTVAY